MLHFHLAPASASNPVSIRMSQFANMQLAMRCREQYRTAVWHMLNSAGLLVRALLHAHMPPLLFHSHADDLCNIHMTGLTGNLFQNLHADHHIV